MTRRTALINRPRSPRFTRSSPANHHSEKTNRQVPFCEPVPAESSGRARGCTRTWTCGALQSCARTRRTVSARWTSRPCAVPLSKHLQHLPDDIKLAADALRKFHCGQVDDLEPVFVRTVFFKHLEPAGPHPRRGPPCVQGNLKNVLRQCCALARDAAHHCGRAAAPWRSSISSCVARSAAVPASNMSAPRRATAADAGVVLHPSRAQKLDLSCCPTECCCSRMSFTVMPGREVCSQVLWLFFAACVVRVFLSRLDNNTCMCKSTSHTQGSCSMQQLRTRAATHDRFGRCM